MLRDDVLRALEENRDTAVSGQALADRFGVSRNAVWKVINQLREEGHEILSDGNKGYRLDDASDVLSEAGIRVFLPEREDLKVAVYPTIDSTNNEAKRRLGAGDGGNLLIVADAQTAGRGRMGHTFYSPDGSGIYMTLSIDLANPLYQPERITLAAAVAVVRALQPYLDEELRLKWVNDIFYREKKVCGILSEGVTDLETGLIQHAIVGIGINVRPAEFPEELRDIAGTLGILSPSRNEIVGRIVTELLDLYQDLSSDLYLQEYLKFSMHPDKVREFLGKS